MRALLTLSALSALFALLALPAFAETQKPQTRHAKPAGPQAIGTFEDWTAATDREAGQTICYAFTRARSSTPTLPGRGDVVLTVTERPGGRDAVAISAGFAFAANATAKLVVDSDSFDLYTAQRSAFARDGHAVVQAMHRGKQALARAPGPKGAEVADTFSLRGFTAAYNAIVKRCPPGKPAS
jgi:hypothetical protein